ncbi:MAG: energy transducer TonB, partial [Holophagales bacterium]|nr:energy transducer TonB [Holophagales bacterium]
RRQELDEILRSISSLLPEHSAWAEDGLEYDPILPDELASPAIEKPPFVGIASSRRVYLPKGDVSKPEKLRAPQPQYTEAARLARIQGVMILRLLIDDRGRVARVGVWQGLDPGLDQHAVETVAQWEFEPATLNGDAVWAVYNLTVKFGLQ